MRDYLDIASAPDDLRSARVRLSVLERRGLGRHALEDQLFEAATWTGNSFLDMVPLLDLMSRVSDYEDVYPQSPRFIENLLGLGLVAGHNGDDLLNYVANFIGSGIDSGSLSQNHFGHLIEGVEHVDQDLAGAVEESLSEVLANIERDNGDDGTGGAPLTMAALAEALAPLTRDIRQSVSSQVEDGVMPQDGRGLSNAVGNIMLRYPVDWFVGWPDNGRLHERLSVFSEEIELLVGMMSEAGMKLADIPGAMAAVSAMTPIHLPVETVADHAYPGSTEAIAQTQEIVDEIIGNLRENVLHELSTLTESIVNEDDSSAKGAGDRLDIARDLAAYDVSSRWGPAFGQDDAAALAAGEAYVDAWMRALFEQLISAGTIAPSELLGEQHGQLLPVPDGEDVEAVTRLSAATEAQAEMINSIYVPAVEASVGLIDAETTAIKGNVLALDAEIAATNRLVDALRDLAEARQAAGRGPDGTGQNGPNGAVVATEGGMPVVVLHGGGVVGRGGVYRFVAPGMFAGARRFHQGGVARYGLASGEVPAILQSGEEVLTAADPRHQDNLGTGGPFQRLIDGLEPESVERLTDAWNAFAEVVGDAVPQALHDVVFGVQSLNDALSSMGRSIAQRTYEEAVAPLLSDTISDFIMDNFAPAAPEEGLGDIDPTSTGADGMIADAESLTDAANEARDAWQEMADTIGQEVVGAIGQAIFSGREFSEILSELLLKIAEVVLQTLVIEPLTQGLTAGIQALFPAGHSGGIAGSLAERRKVSPLVFAGAQHYHSGGLAGDEVPAILRRGEEVLTRDDPRHRANGGMAGGGVVNVNTHVVIEGGAVNNNGLGPEAEAAVGRQIDRAVGAAVDRRIARQMRVGGMLNRVA